MFLPLFINDPDGRIHTETRNLSFSMNCLPTLKLGVGCFGEEGGPKNIAAQSAFFVVRTPQGWSLVSDKDYTTYVTLHKKNQQVCLFDTAI